MKRFLQFGFFGLLFAAGAMMGCAGNNSQSIPAVSPYGTYGTTCVAGQPCPLTTACVPGTLGCATTGTGYFHYSGQMSSVNSGIARTIVGNMTGVTSYCIGSCPNYSSIDIYVPNTGATAGEVGQANIVVNNVPISGGQAAIYPTASGDTIVITAYGIGTMTVNTSLPLNGSVSQIPAAQILYNAQQFATVSLILLPY